jgi:hypothetical protein
MRDPKIAGGQTTAWLGEELSVVTLTKPVQTKEGVVPAAASGTMVHADGDGQAVATVEADAIAGLLMVSAEAFEAFQARLDAPPRPNEKLRRALLSPQPWT